jgi:hypothetical protein
MLRPLIFQPILAREFRQVMARSDTFALRAIPPVVFAIAYFVVVRTAGNWSGVRAGQFIDHDVLTRLGVSALAVTVVAQFFVASFALVSGIARTIAQEREKDTLNSLVLTQMTSEEIIGQKIGGRLLPMLTAVATGVPLCLFAGWAIGLPPLLQGLVIALTFTTPVLMGCLASYASAGQPSAGRAVGLAWTIVALWLILPTLARVPWPVPWWLYDVSQALRAIVEFIGKSSPISLLPDLSWTKDPTHHALAERLQIMLGLQAFLGCVAFYAASKNLCPHDKLPIGWTKQAPVETNRPVCGDDPIVWREYTMPRRHLGRRFLVNSFRQFGILLRAFLPLVLSVFVVLLGIFGLLVMWGTLIAFYGSVLWFAIPAIREAWWGPVTPADPHAAGNAFRNYIRVVSMLLSLITLRVAADSAKQRITTERAKKTWSIFLVTPLEAREIVGGKLRASLMTVRGTIIFLGVIWLLGVLSGVVNVFGVLVAAIDLLVGTAFFALIGFRAALKDPNDVMPSSLNWSNSAILAVHLGLIVLAPGFGTILPQIVLAGALVLIAYAVMIAITAFTAVAAWHTWGEIIERFDEWVDRPRPAILNRAAMDQRDAVENLPRLALNTEATG